MPQAVSLSRVLLFEKVGAEVIHKLFHRRVEILTKLKVQP